MNDVQELLSRLGFIAMIAPGERVDTITLNIQSGSLYERSMRAVFSRSESRQTTYTFIKKTIEDSVLIAEKCNGQESSELNQKMKDKFIKALTSSLTGINSLKITYSSDRMYVSRLTILAELLEMRIGELHPCPVEESAN
jgi:hypothetical protein